MVVDPFAVEFASVHNKSKGERVYVAGYGKKTAPNNVQLPLQVDTSPTSAAARSSFATLS